MVSNITESTYTRLDFIEPNLSFGAGEKEETFQIIVRLSIELNPSWCKEEEYELHDTIFKEDEKILFVSLKNNI